MDNHNKIFITYTYVREDYFNLLDTTYGRYPLKNINLVTNINNQDDYIQWIDNKGSQKARVYLNNIFNHYSNNSIYHSFLSDNCYHLINAPTGNTGVLKSSLLLENLQLNNESFKLPSNYIAKLFPNGTGVYAVTSLDPNDYDQYIGSALDFKIRWIRHYDKISDSANTVRPFHSVIMENNINMEYLWTPVVKTVNYLELFIENYPDEKFSVDFEQALKTFSQYEIRLIEQSIIYDIKPSLNSSDLVKYNFQWKRDITDIKDNRTSIIALDYETGGKNSIINFNSINDRSKVLDIDYRSIYKIINYEGYYCTSKSNGIKYSFINPEDIMKTGNPKGELPLLDYEKYKNIPNGETWIFDKNIKKVSSSSINVKDIANEYSIKLNTYKRFLNRGFVKRIAIGVSMKLLFLTNRGKSSSKKVEIITTNQLTKEVPKYKSIRDAWRDLNNKTLIEHGNKYPGSFGKNYVNTEKLYKNEWILTKIQKN